ncbi:MAG: A/G-specific adenine glycosylase [Burkholderiaceae bacterium]|nr:MAG: A/G-specific adenine glycosylase [Burkholderiaceae bacterium]TAM07455.1 MAG: A/G-specific adenine glycosylase [Pusillimonas sp.]
MVAGKALAIDEFATAIAQWQRAAGRNNLPWQNSHDPYRIWLSEIMLQQTQVSTAIGYYERFLKRFPTVQALAQATQDEVMPYWAGLGYYARARNLHQCAREICETHGGQFPHEAEQIMQLPGIGRSTAAAIAAFAYGKRDPIMDGNVKRVFTRYFGIFGDPATRATERRLWETAQKVLDAAPPDLDMTAYTQGLMDLGASLCSRGQPNCAACPLAASCYACVESRQADLPVRKRKKQVEERECAMLILQSDGRILLERRPSRGIWGGLWSLPQYDDAHALRETCRNMGLTADDTCRMAGLRHTFSHFKLNIEPWHVEAGATVLAEPRTDQAWIAIRDLASAALPAPVRKILAGLFQAAA